MLFYLALNLRWLLKRKRYVYPFKPAWCGFFHFDADVFQSEQKTHRVATVGFGFKSLTGLRQRGD